ncbi:MAG: hypothetical protein ACHP7N_19705 [Caulobacterales bacterium]
MRRAVYGVPPAELVEIADGAVQLSPLIPGSDALEDEAEGSLHEIVVAAPRGAVERRYVLAHALRALKSGGALTALAPKDRGGLRLFKELAAFGCEVAEDARRHYRICTCRRPAAPVGLEAAIVGGAPQMAPRLGLWSQPGVFSWDRPDPGSARLASLVGAHAGEGAHHCCCGG